jgi:hypothetical protein
VKGVRPLPFLIPFFGLSTLFCVISIWKGGGWWWLTAVLPAAFLVAIVQALLRGAPGA